MSRPTRSSSAPDSPAAGDGALLTRRAAITLLGWGCTHGSAHAARKGSMMDFDALMRQARIQVSDKVPEQSRQSLPIPKQLSKGLHIGFMFAPSQAMPGLNRLAPPNWVAWLQPTSGELAALQAVTPASFGQQHDARQMIGEFRLPPGMNADAYLAERRKLLDLYTTVVMAWDGGLPPQHAGLQAPAAEFLRLFGLLAEGPLIPYYYALGTPFFEWTRAAASPGGK
jgi:hypothetical protein